MRVPATKAARQLEATTVPFRKYAGSFTPEQLEILTTAFYAAIAELTTKSAEISRQDLARRILEKAAGGIFDVDELKRAALVGLRANRQRDGTTKVGRVASLAMKPPSLISVLCSLYASDIKVSICISSSWDDGWEVKLGDTVSGAKAERTFANAELDEVAHWLAEQASLNYPESDFARRFADFKKRSRRGTKSRRPSLGKSSALRGKA